MGLAKEGKNNPMYGKHRSEKIKEKISIANQGKNNPFYGKHHTERVKQIVIESNKRRRGSLSSNWKGGITSLRNIIRNSYKAKQWRNEVFTRDDFTCQECGKRGGYLEAHHDTVTFADIIELNDIRTFEQAMDCEELWDINNGITLCKKCHKDTKKSEVIHYECTSYNLC